MEETCSLRASERGSLIQYVKMASQSWLLALRYCWRFRPHWMLELVGVYNVIGGGSVVTCSIPDCCVALEGAAHVVRHFNTTARAWESVLL